MQVDEVVDEDSQGAVSPAETPEVNVVLRVSAAEDVACESVELVTGKGVMAEFSALVDIPFALPVVRKVPDTPDRDVAVSKDWTDVEVVFIHVDAVEVIAASDRLEALGLSKVVVRCKVVVLV